MPCGLSVFSSRMQFGVPVHRLVSAAWTPHYLSQPGSQCLNNEQQPSQDISWAGQDNFNGTLQLLFPALESGWPLSLSMCWAFAHGGAQLNKQKSWDGPKYYSRGLEHWIYSGFKYGQLFGVGSVLTSRKAVNGIYKRLIVCVVYYYMF